MTNSKRIRLALLLVVAACAFSATASAALAVTVEPLNTKFSGALRTGTVAEFEFGGGPGKCTGGTLTGTTNATKTNFFNATPGFTGCSVELGEVVFASKCAKEGTVPWTITLLEGEKGKAGKASLTTNCEFTDRLVGIPCVLSAPPQTPTSEITWTNGAGKLELTVFDIQFKNSKWSSPECEGIGFPAKIVINREQLNIPGIKVS